MGHEIDTYKNQQNQLQFDTRTYDRKAQYPKYMEDNTKRGVEPK